MAWFQEWFGEQYLQLYSYRQPDQTSQPLYQFQLVSDRGKICSWCTRGRVLKQNAVFLFDYLNLHRELQRLIERWYDPSDRSFNKWITIGPQRYLERVRGYDLGSPRCLPLAG
jgi:hypothetical protein